APVVASRPPITTAAPSLASNAAVALPMPRVPPVTIATRPSSSMALASERGVVSDPGYESSPDDDPPWSGQARQIRERVAIHHEQIRQPPGLDRSDLRVEPEHLRARAG